MVDGPSGPDILDTQNQILYFFITIYFRSKIT